MTRLRTRRVTKGGRGALPGKVAWLHTLPCYGCRGCPVEVHHERVRGSRADDRVTLPLCPSCHRTGPHARHRIGREVFERRHGEPVLVACQRYHAQWEAA